MSEQASDTGRAAPREDAEDELERQARETISQVRQRVGALGQRVRRVVERANAHWESTAPAPPSGAPTVAVDAGEQARALLRRWVAIDFLVDPELPAGMAVHRLEQSALWRVELRERGETRRFEQLVEPHPGDDQGAAAAEPARRSPWDYAFPSTPEIQSGERRERLADGGAVAACAICGGTGRRGCRACDGAGTEPCPVCHGRARHACPSCRGRGRVPAPRAERRPRAGAPHIHAHAHRLAAEAGENLADATDRLRLALGVPVPAAREWVHSAAVASEWVPCPDCHDGTVPCECGTGRSPCAVCGGAGRQPCATCKGSGRVADRRDVVRRFDTRLGHHTIPLDGEMASWLPAELLARATGERVWAGAPGDAGSTPTPPGVPDAVWRTALTFAARARTHAPPDAGPGERRVIERRLVLMRVPLTRLHYEFAGRHYRVVAYGPDGAERFSAEVFPHRWSRVGRFLRAITRDLAESGPAPAPPSPPPALPSGPPPAREPGETGG